MQTSQQDVIHVNPQEGGVKTCKAEMLIPSAWLLSQKPLMYNPLLPPVKKKILLLNL